eukprot:GHVT01032212.1.p1 GENE.GHVT01032212.1~~GHVT01032212.1.p1  ORF type:complete len:793 (-),score=112.15 GHVT01032212.1:366-2744(-)
METPRLWGARTRGLLGCLELAPPKRMTTYRPWQRAAGCRCRLAGGWGLDDLRLSFRTGAAGCSRASSLQIVPRARGSVEVSGRRTDDASEPPCLNLGDRLAVSLGQGLVAACWRRQWSKRSLCSAVEQSAHDHSASLESKAPGATPYPTIFQALPPPQPLVRKGGPQVFGARRRVEGLLTRLASAASAASHAESAGNCEALWVHLGEEVCRLHSEMSPSQVCAALGHLARGGRRDTRALLCLSAGAVSAVPQLSLVCLGVILHALARLQMDNQILLAAVLREVHLRMKPWEERVPDTHAANPPPAKAPIATPHMATSLRSVHGMPVHPPCDSARANWHALPDSGLLRPLNGQASPRYSSNGGRQPLTAVADKKQRPKDGCEGRLSHSHAFGRTAAKGDDTIDAGPARPTACSGSTRGVDCPSRPSTAALICNALGRLSGKLPKLLATSPVAMILPALGLSLTNWFNAQISYMTPMQLAVASRGVRLFIGDAVCGVAPSIPRSRIVATFRASQRDAATAARRLGVDAFSLCNLHHFLSALIPLPDDRQQPYHEVDDFRQETIHRLTHFFDGLNICQAQNSNLNPTRYGRWPNQTNNRQSSDVESLDGKIQMHSLNINKHEKLPFSPSSASVSFDIRAAVGCLRNLAFCEVQTNSGADAITSSGILDGSSITSSSRQENFVSNSPDSSALGLISSAGRAFGISSIANRLDGSAVVALIAIFSKSTLRSRQKFASQWLPIAATALPNLAHKQLVELATAIARMRIRDVPLLEGISLSLMRHPPTDASWTGGRHKG